MSRNDKGKVSRHEQLRYEYLLRNIAYLSDREQAEFDYLRKKVEASSAEEASYYDEPEEDYYQDYEQSYDDYYDDDYQDADSWEEDSSSNQYTDQGLPVYPDQTSNRSRQSRKEKKAAQAPAKVKPKKKQLTFKRFLKIISLILLAVFVGMIIMFIKGMHDISSGKNKDYKPAVVEEFNGQDAKDGTNILVLGSDQRITQGSSEARTDTIMVVNVGNKDKKVKMVSFMRDTLVNIKGVSADNYSYDNKLNTAFNIGEQDNNQGAELMRQTLKRNFDIDIKYYVMVDFQTFAEAIDTLFPNGVEINAKFATVDGNAVDSVEVPDDLNMKNGVVPNQTISVGRQKMDGRTLLNYARFRKDDEGDFGRTKRQQQVMSAVMSQIKNPAKLFTGSAALGKIYALTSTNISYGFLLSHGLSVLTNGKEIEQITVPEYGDWLDDYDMYGGQALSINFKKYKKRLTKLGIR
ncbi:LCP family protein [Streptococcus caviae]|uniref:LCP family protein n=1 Tax=Streptococcus sp. 'caviae' TaxID=1915004 RepID=UPI00094BA85A|nr:LCP family protein [Streptococcus sp. 'caviae']OLN82748.1 LytR family transcriptional regulator [Streptococcus sp. 'caviae']